MADIEGDNVAEPTAPENGMAADRAPMDTVSPDVAAVIRKWRRLAMRGDQLSARRHGHCGGSTFLARDDARSLYWFTRAAGQGDFMAQQALGAAYQSGVHVPKDLALSAFWYGKAADQLRAEADRGSLKGEYGLGLCYAEGHGVPRDITQALFWLRAALKQQVDDRKSPGSIYSDMKRLIEQLEAEEKADDARPSNNKG